jgi:hypothetical protein
MAAAVIIVIAGLVIGGLFVFSPGSGRPPTASRSGSTESLGDLAMRGVSGSFYEVYRVTGSTDGTVEAAQSAPTGQAPFPTGDGKWSFVYQAKQGFTAQWIEEGPAAWSCWQPVGDETWKCGGPGHYYGANGFALSIEPYIPGIVLDEATTLKRPPTQVKHINYYSSSSRSFGPLRCVRVEGTVFQSTSACFDQHGILVSQVGGGLGAWRTITLLSYRSSVPPSAFELKAKSSSTDVVFPSGPL